MASKVSVRVSGTSTVASCEISGGASVDLNQGSGTKQFTVGQSGSMIQFLTVRRESPGTIVISSISGNLVVEVDGNYKSPKKLKPGGKLTLSSKNTRALVKEAVK